MLDKTKENKIKRFMADEVMSGAVKEFLRETFLKNNGSKDVQTLAAERIAISLLDIGFNELRRFSQKTEQEVKNQPNPGL